MQTDKYIESKMVETITGWNASPAAVYRMMKGLNGAADGYSTVLALNHIFQQKRRELLSQLQSGNGVQVQEEKPRERPGERKPQFIPKNRREFFDLAFPEICWVRSHRPDIYSLYMKK